MRRHSEIFIPPEWYEHQCCWMSWGIFAEENDSADIEIIRNQLSRIIRTIAEDEPVNLLTPLALLDDARARFSSCCQVRIIPSLVDDIWMRDIAPTFALRNRREVIAIDWNFNSWGDSKFRRSRPGDGLAKSARNLFGVDSIAANFVGEGGAFAFDNFGTVITTESCLLNANRNSPNDRDKIQDELMKKFGAKSVVWLKGERSELITNGHVDGYILPAPDGTLLVDIDNQPTSRAGTSDFDRLKQALLPTRDCIVIRGPRRRYLNKLEGTPHNGWSDCFAPCYLNAYVTNKRVITGCFGDPDRDELAAKTLTSAFNKETVMLSIHHIANRGGGVHCLAQPMPTPLTA